jgi:hypothetical protein
VDGGNGNARQFLTVPDEGSRMNDSRRPIGEIFVELGFVSRTELQSALEVQRTAGGRIGEILVEQGSLSRIDLASALAEHWEPHAYDQEGESLEGSLDGALRSAIDQAAGQTVVDAHAKPKRSRLRRSATREDALEQQVGRVSEQLVAFGRDSALRADRDRALVERLQALTLRLDRVESRADEIDRLEAQLGTVSELAAELRSELTALPRHEPAPDPGERLLELSLRIDHAARESHDRIAALAAELSTEVGVKSAGLDARLQAHLDEAAELQRRVAAAQAAAESTFAGAEETAAELHVEIASLAGRLDELFGLRHADAQAARVANERLAARLEDLNASQFDDDLLDRLAGEVGELTRRVEQMDSIGEQSARVVERAVLEGLADFGKQLTAKAPKQGKPSKRLCRSIEALAAAIAAADARSSELEG